MSAHTRPSLLTLGSTDAGRQRFVIGGLECDWAMILIITLIPTFLLLLTCVAGKGDMLDIEELRREELRRIGETLARTVPETDPVLTALRSEAEQHE